MPLEPWRKVATMPLKTWSKEWLLVQHLRFKNNSTRFEKLSDKQEEEILRKENEKGECEEREKEEEGEKEISEKYNGTNEEYQMEVDEQMEDEKPLPEDVINEKSADYDINETNLCVKKQKVETQHLGKMFRQHPKEVINLVDDNTMEVRYYEAIKNMDKKTDQFYFKDLHNKEAMLKDYRDLQWFDQLNADLENLYEINENEKEMIVAKICVKHAPLSLSDYEMILHVLDHKHLNDTVMEGFGMGLTLEKCLALGDGQWLNDEIINLYMAMLKDKLDRAIILKGDINTKETHFFNTFFWCKLTENDTYKFSNIEKWIKKIEKPFECDKIFIPINIKNVHWTMIVISFLAKEICYVDSCAPFPGGKKYDDRLKIAIKFLNDWAAKERISFDSKEWKLKMPEVPQQSNGFDCGMFTIYCAHYLSEDLPPYYNQEQMAINRLKVFAAILNKTLVDPGEVYAVKN